MAEPIEVAEMKARMGVFDIKKYQLANALRVGPEVVGYCFREAESMKPRWRTALEKLEASAAEKAG